MALPKIEYPTFELTLPSSKQKIKYRPFLVKEEKLLLMAQSSEDSKEIVNSIRQVLNNCILTEGVVVDSLTTFDLEYLFVKIRAKSVNNMISLTYRDMEDDQRYTVEVDLDQIEIIEDPDHNNDIKVNDTTGIILRHPKADLSNLLKENQNEMDVFFDILKYCIEYVYQGNEKFDFQDNTEEEKDEFISSLNVESFKQIQKYFSTMPRLHYEVKYTNSKGTERIIPLNTLNDFFSLG